MIKNKSKVLGAINERIRQRVQSSTDRDGRGTGQSVGTIQGSGEHSQILGDGQGPSGAGVPISGGWAVIVGNPLTRLVEAPLHLKMERLEILQNKTDREQEEEEEIKRLKMEIAQAKNKS